MFRFLVLTFLTFLFFPPTLGSLLPDRPIPPWLSKRGDETTTTGTATTNLITTLDTTTKSPSVTSNLATSPSETAPTAKSTSTEALKMARKLLDSSTSQCIQAGGGCSVFDLTLAPSICRNDQCACADDVTLSAMVCAQCNSDQGSVELYNDYLKICVDEGVASPSDTVVVTVGGGTAVSSPTTAPVSEPTKTEVTTTSEPLETEMPDVKTETIKAQGTTYLISSPTGTSPNTGDSASTDSAGEVAAFAAGDETGEEASSLEDTGTDAEATTTDAEASGSGGLLTDFVTHTSMSEIIITPTPTGSGTGNPSATDVAALQSSEDTSTASSLGEPALALDSAKGYFGVEIDAKCDEDCQTWKDLAQSCTTDKCVCTETALRSASACSSCLGSTTHGEPYQKQMLYYTGFTGNCSSQITSLSSTPTGAIKANGYDMVDEASTSLTSPSDDSKSLTSPGVTVTKAGAGEAVITIATDGHVSPPCASIWPVIASIGTIAISLATMM